MIGTSILGKDVIAETVSREFSSDMRIWVLSLLSAKKTALRVPFFLS